MTLPAIGAGGPVWSWAAGPWNALPGVELAHATRRSLKLSLAGSSEASFTLDGAAPEADRIGELVTDLWCLRNGFTLFRGRVGPSTHTLDGSSHTISYTVGDYRALLQRRILLDGDPLSYTNVDQATISWNLIATTQARVGGNLNLLNGATSTGVVAATITPPQTTAAQKILDRLNSGAVVFEDFTWPGCPQIVSQYNDDLSGQFYTDRSANWPDPYDAGSSAVSSAKSWLASYIADNPPLVTNVPTTPYSTTVLRTTAYAGGQSIGQAIDGLSRLGDGFDWDVVPATGQVPQVFTVWPSRGEARQRVVAYPGDIASLTRQVDPGDYANAVRESGATGIAAVQAAAPDLATRDEGRWDAQLGDTNLADAGQVAARAAYDLADRQQIAPAYSVKLRPGSWGGPPDIWLGDSVLLVISSGRLQVAEELRVHGIDIDLDDADTETVTLTLSALDPAKRARARQLEYRLAQLERR